MRCFDGRPRPIQNWLTALQLNVTTDGKYLSRNEEEGEGVEGEEVVEVDVLDPVLQAAHPRPHQVLREAAQVAGLPAAVVHGVQSKFLHTEQ